MVVFVLYTHGLFLYFLSLYAAMYTLDLVTFVQPFSSLSSLKKLISFTGLKHANILFSLSCFGASFLMSDVSMGLCVNWCES